MQAAEQHIKDNTEMFDRQEKWDAIQGNFLLTKEQDAPLSAWVLFAKTLHNL